MANIEQKFREACQQSGLASMLQQLNNPALNGLVSATLNILKQNASGNTVTGVIKSVGQKVNVSKQAGKEYLKRELVLDLSRYNPDNGEKIPNYVSMNFLQKHCDDLNGLNPGDKVEVKFRLGGREWKGKIINDITGYGVEVLQPASSAEAPQAVAPQPVQAPQYAQAPQPTYAPQPVGDPNNLPF